jgi:hypothetical protein
MTPADYVNLVLTFLLQQVYSRTVSGFSQTWNAMVAEVGMENTVIYLVVFFSVMLVVLTTISYGLNKLFGGARRKATHCKHFIAPE